MFDNCKFNPMPNEVYINGYDEDLMRIIYTNFMLYYQELSLKYIKRSYAGFDVKAQTLIQAYIESSGNLGHKNIKNKPSFNFRIPVKHLLNDDIKHNTQQIFDSTLKKDKLNSTMRENIKQFLKQCIKYNSLPFEITTDIYKKLPRYRISYADSLAMLLLFTYQDGRKYNDDEEKGPSRSTKLTKCSTESYKKALEQVLSFFPENPFEKDWFLNVSQLYQIEKIFKFFRTAQLEQKKNEFLSDENLQLICDSFKLQYREILNLEKTLNDNIFENSEFIEYCIKSDYPDAFQLFSYFFKKYMINKHISNHKVPMENSELEYHILFCQIETKKYINKFLSYLNQLLKEDIEKVNHCDIDNIYLELNPYINNFKPYANAYKKYYINTRNVLEDYINPYTSGTSEYTKNLFEIARNSIPNFYK